MWKNKIKLSGSSVFSNSVTRQIHCITFYIFDLIAFSLNPILLILLQRNEMTVKQLYIRCIKPHCGLAYRIYNLISQSLSDLDFNLNFMWHPSISEKYETPAIIWYWHYSYNNLCLFKMLTFVILKKKKILILLWFNWSQCCRNKCSVTRKYICIQNISLMQFRWCC